MGRGIFVFCLSGLFAIKLSLNFWSEAAKPSTPPEGYRPVRKYSRKTLSFFSLIPRDRSDRAVSRGGLKSLNCLGKKMYVSVRMCAFLQGDGGKYKNRKSAQKMQVL